MIEITAKISSKNQITLPADIRRRLGIGASDTIAFVLAEDGKVELRPAQYDLESILGSIKPLPNETVDLDREITEATAAGIERLGRRKL